MDDKSNIKVSDAPEVASDQTPETSGSTGPFIEPAIEPASPTSAASTQLQQRQRARQLAQALRNELQKAVIGQNAVIEQARTC
ncbi:hypothetical protein Pgy4_07079, partial [Pseudomonas savastanoi pv. glycinea str. race 4]